MNTTVAKRIEFLNNFKAKRNDNTIVLFRDMDFYFMYNEDAENVGNILGATGKIAHAEDFTFGAFASSKLDVYLPVPLTSHCAATTTSYVASTVSVLETSIVRYARASSSDATVTV